MNADQIKKDIMMKKSPEMEIKNFKEKEELLQEEFDIRYGQEKTKQQVLIVDDSELNRQILAEILAEDFVTIEATDGKECISILKKKGTDISLVLLDIVMPLKNGFEVLEEMANNHWIEEIPVIMISSEDSTAAIRRAYELGVADYISRPFDAQVVYRRVMNTIKLYARQRHLVDLVKDQLYEKEKNNRMMIAILSEIVEFRSGESGPHVLYINMLTKWLLEELVHRTEQYPLSWTDRLQICTAASLHDIGKIGIPESILNKHEKLTTEEFEEMKKHTLIGASILKNLDMYQKEPLLKTAYQICRWHHERYDGKGYPDGLKGEEIPIAAQIVSLADTYNALVNDRPYRKAYSHETALKMILDGERGSFNPILLECLKRIHTKIRQEYEKTALGRKEASFLKDNGKTKELFLQTIAKESEDF